MADMSGKRRGMHMMSSKHGSTLENRGGYTSAPAYLMPCASSPSSHVSLSSQAVVILQGLPAALCSGAMLEATLDQAGLEEELITSQVVHAGSQHGKSEVHATFKTVKAAKRCVRHFHGRQWGSSVAPVAARLAQPADTRAEPVKVICADTRPADRTPLRLPQKSGPHIDLPPGLEHMFSQPRSVAAVLAANIRQVPTPSKLLGDWLPYLPDETYAYAREEYTQDWYRNDLPLKLLGSGLSHELFKTESTDAGSSQVDLEELEAPHMDS